MLEANGPRLDRPWTLAVGYRCRAVLLAAQGDVRAATVAAQQAMTEHDRLPMPFERARTQLVLGRLHRCQRQRNATSTVWREALGTFEALNTPLWADRVRAELARTDVNAGPAKLLTAVERQVAELAARMGSTRGGPAPPSRVAAVDDDDRGDEHQGHDETEVPQRSPRPPMHFVCRKPRHLGEGEHVDKR
jgi:hypothetical protein